MTQGRKAGESSIFDHLKVWKKLALIAALAALPAAVLLYLLVDEKSIAIQFTQQEMYGTQYLRPLISLQRRLQELWLLEESARHGNARSTSAALAIRTAIRADVERLESVHTTFRSRLTAVDGDQRLSDEIDRLHAKLSAAPITSVRPGEGLLLELRNVIAHIGYASHLALDPDLDSHSLNAMVLTILPAVRDQLVRIAAMRTDGQAPTEKDRTRRAVEVGLLRERLEELRDTAASAFESTVDNDLQSTLAGPLDEAIDASVAFLRLTEHPGGDAQQGPAAGHDIGDARAKAIEKSDALWMLSVHHLDRLLAARIDRLRGRTVVAFGGVAILMLLSAAMLVQISTRLSRRISELAGAAQQIIGHAEGGEDFTGIQFLPSVARDEVGNLERSLARMTAKVKQSITALRVASTQLEEHNQTLERKVEERTVELTAANAELARALDQIKKTREQLFLQEKMASFGTLIAGIAHEIQNPMNFVCNFTTLSAELIPDLQQALASQKHRLDGQAAARMEEALDELAENVDLIDKHGKRADSIVRGMLALSGGQAREFEPVDINELLTKYINLVHHGLRARDPGMDVVIRQEYDPNAGVIQAVPQDLSRALLNIVSNACYAAHQKRRRTTGNLAGAGTDSSGFIPQVTTSSKDAGDWVEVRIRDNGNGIPKDIRQRIFEPFFTTKPPGQGPGLGLSLSYDIIVRQHGGQLRVETEEGEFTELIILLPRKPPQGDTSTGEAE